MKITAAIVLTAFLAYVAGIYTVLPWWSFAITSFIVAMAIHQRAWKAFVSGFLGLFFLWAGLALLKDFPNEHILSRRVAGILPLGGSYLVLIAVTGIVGGLVSGMAALTGSYLRRSPRSFRR